MPLKRNIANFNLSKDYILSKVDEIDIASRYLGISRDVIIDCINNNTFISSPFRIDKHPSFGFTINNKKKLKARDFAGYFQGDIFDIVAYVVSIQIGRQINVNKKSEFYFILKHIANTFYDKFNIEENNQTQELNNAIKKLKQQKSIIEVATRQWNNADKILWAKWNISLNALNTHFVYPVDQYYINRYINPEPKYKYNPKNPAYAYLLGMDNKGIYNIKIYFPNREKEEIKFITNCNCLEGIPNLELSNYDYIIVTKSSKDRISLDEHLSSLSLYGGDGNKLVIGVINLPSESYRLKKKEYDYLKGKLKSNGMIISLLDFDATGRSGAKYLKDKYDIPYIFITRGQFGFYDYKAKDFAELNEQYHYEDITRFIKETLSYINLMYKDYAEEI